MAPPLFTAHSRALTILYSDLESYALGQQQVFEGTPGSVIERRNAAGFRFYAHQFYDADGKKRERYLAGPVGDAQADTVAQEARARVREVNDVLPSLRLLGREGFGLADARTYATIASLHNHGLFAAGAVLIGSHAYGVLLNALGVRAVPYATEDVDIARPRPLALSPPPAEGFLDILKESGIDFVEVPELDPSKGATSFKQRGRSRFHVDLLAPSRTEGFAVVAVPELRAHATGLPGLEFLLAQSQTAPLLARQGCCAVRVPLPERLAVHKLLASRLRLGAQAKSDKDVFQASVLSAALAELHPGALAAARARLPKRALKRFRQAVESARRWLEDAHPRAWEELGGSPA